MRTKIIPPATPAPIIISIERASSLVVFVSSVDAVGVFVGLLVSRVGVGDVVAASPILHAPWTSRDSISKSQEDSICNRFP